jgi:hypothetical protein
MCCGSRKVFQSKEELEDAIARYCTFEAAYMEDVTDVIHMFYGAAFSQDIGSWATSNVTDMSFMIYGVTAFNQGIGSWDMSNVTNICGMLYGAPSFCQDFSSWDVFGVMFKEHMFGATDGIQLLPNAWQNDNNLEEMFSS